MKIGNGVLEIGIIGIRIDSGRMVDLARKTISIPPLNQILHFRLTNEEEARKIGSIDLISFIDERTESRFEDDVIFSEANPRILAHELGHALGLEHPFNYCGVSAFFGCRYPLHLECPHPKYIMGCCKEGEKVEGFSPENLIRLEGWYLK